MRLVALALLAVAVLMSLAGCVRENEVSTPTPTVDDTFAIVTPTTGTSVQPAAVAGGRVYVVAAGDTLSSIAARFGVSTDELARANHLANPNDIKVGQELIIPSS